MKVLLLTHGTYLDQARVASGNSVRAYYLARALAEHGVDVIYAYPRDLGAKVGAKAHVPRRVQIRAFRDGHDLRRLVDETRPGALLVGYWELLEHLPQEPSVPVVVDVLAPRLLEVLFQPDRSPADEARRMLRLYRRADRFLCGSERQRHLLVPWLLLAGFQVADRAPIDVIPVSSLPLPPRRPRGRGPWRLVMGGVDWPWRRPEAYVEAVASALAGGQVQGQLLWLSGPYVHGGAKRAPEPPTSPRARQALVRSAPLLPYGDMVRLFRQSHVGLELAQQNLEREYSLSFRSVEWLRCGVPIICNDYLTLAGAVGGYDAGWVISSPDEVAGVLRELTPRRWNEKSANALRLVRERFHYRHTVAPLLRYLREPSRPRRGPALLELAGPRRP